MSVLVVSLREWLALLRETRPMFWGCLDWSAYLLVFAGCVAAASRIVLNKMPDWRRVLAAALTAQLYVLLFQVMPPPNLDGPVGPSIASVLGRLARPGIRLLKSSPVILLAIAPVVAYLVPFRFFLRDPGTGNRLSWRRAGCVALLSVVFYVCAAFALITAFPR